MWDELCINGYLFSTPEEYREAKKEEEAVKYIKLKTNLKDIDNVLKLYNTLLEKKTLHTIIGIQFLHELQSVIEKNKQDSEIKPISLEDMSMGSATKKSNIQNKEQRLNNVLELYKSKNKNLKIVVFFLSILLIALFVITFTGDNSPLISEEEKLQDKYAAWEEELTMREQALAEQLQQLDTQE